MNASPSTFASTAGSGASYSSSGSYYTRARELWFQHQKISFICGEEVDIQGLCSIEAWWDKEEGNLERLPILQINIKPECRPFNPEVCSSHGRFGRITDASSRYLAGTLISKFASHAERNSCRGATYELNPHTEQHTA